jgi:hypothetical protein
MFANMKIAIAAVLVLGTASAALASNEHDQDVSESQAMREMHENPLPWWWNAPMQGRGGFANAGVAYGYVAIPTQQDSLSRKRSHNR